MKNISYLLLILIFFGCKTEDKKTEKLLETKLENGLYRADLKIDENLTIPFSFQVKDETHLTIFNSDEEIMVDEITYNKDSVYIKLPVFEGVIKAKIYKDKLKGEFVMPEKGRQMDFVASLNSNRFDIKENAKSNIEGIWETIFSPDSKENSYIAKGVFKQNGNKVTGTFRTTTGDYRYLEGIIDGNQLNLSTFDGAHAFLFTGNVSDSLINGYFYSGAQWKEPFTAKRNTDYELPSADSLTYLKEGYDKIAFTFPDENGKQISLDDERFKDKVVLVQIMGTWCPNCLDESTYFSDYYKKNKSDDFEIVALAFEYVKTEEKAFKNIKRLKDRLEITYPILLAQVGSSSKAKANDKLPMLNHVLSYPTTIFIDKKGKVRKIHTGFNGPATGEKYTEFKTEFERFVNELKSE
jgi:peroxiredoxin